MKITVRVFISSGRYPIFFYQIVLILLHYVRAYVRVKIGKTLPFFQHLQIYQYYIYVDYCLKIFLFRWCSSHIYYYVCVCRCKALAAT